MRKGSFVLLLLASAACSSNSDPAAPAVGDAATSSPDSSSDSGAPAADSATIDSAIDAASDATFDAPSIGPCASIPASATRSGPGCTGVSGTFTEVTYDTNAGTYDETCSATPYPNQADFDANEATSTVTGVTIVSHEDYVITSGCASGSIDYTAQGSAKTTIVFVWTKVP